MPGCIAFPIWRDISFRKFTINYLCDTKSVHNFVYAISPQIEMININILNI